MCAQGISEAIGRDGDSEVGDLRLGKKYAKDRMRAAGGEEMCCAYDARRVMRVRVA